MIDLYISYKVLTECISRNDEKDPLWTIIDKGIVDIFVDIERNVLDELMDGSEYPVINSEGYEDFPTLFDFVNDKDCSLLSGKERMDRVKKKEKYKNTPSSAIFIFDKISKYDIQVIQKKYNFVCLSGDDLSYLSKIISRSNYQHYWDTEDTKERGSWVSIINTLPKYPCDTIVFCDHYLHKNDAWDYRNITDIVKSLCFNNMSERAINILFIWGRDVNAKQIPEKTIIQQANAISKKILKLSNGAAVRIEFIYCVGNGNGYNLYEHTHNRKILTNFSLASVDYDLAAFSIDQRPTKDQRICYDLILSKEIELEHEIILKKIAKDIKKASDNTDKNMDYIYLVSSSEINRGVVNKNEINNLKNRLIMNIVNFREGDKCYYLSVPQNSNWKDIKVLAETYTAEHNYELCIKDKESKPLEILANEIKRLFEGIKSEQATDNDNNFYWVTVTTQSDLKTVKVRSKEDDSNAIASKCFKNNCFKNRKDAEEVVASIKQIIGIE